MNNVISKSHTLTFFGRGGRRRRRGGRRRRRGRNNMCYIHIKYMCLYQHKRPNT